MSDFKIHKGRNEVRIIGTLAKPPREVDAHADGIILGFDVIVEEDRKVDDEWVPEHERVTVWVGGARAKGLAKLKLREGSRVYFDAKVKSGAKGLYLKATDVLLLGGGKRDDDAPEAPHAHRNGAPPKAPDAPAVDNEIPF